MVRNHSRAAGQGGDRPGHGALGTLLGAWNPVQGRRQVRGSSLQSHGRFTETEHEKESEQSPGYDSVKNVHTAETPTALTGLSEASLCPQTCGKLFRSLRTRSLHVEQNHSQSHGSSICQEAKDAATQSVRGTKMPPVPSSPTPGSAAARPRRWCPPEAPARPPPSCPLRPLRHRSAQNGVRCLPTRALGDDKITCDFPTCVRPPRRGAEGAARTCPARSGFHAAAGRTRSQRARPGPLPRPLASRPEARPSPVKDGGRTREGRRGRRRGPRLTAGRRARRPAGSAPP